MLTLDQVRAVNDGFKSGDLNAALQPLEETVDLRSNELPKLDKAALAALKAGLSNGEDAATWAEAIFHPNVSVRRFARKTFMGLGDEAAPLFTPLRARLERFWSEETPLPETSKPREAALRREQRESVNSALELLLRSNPEEFLAFFADLVDNAPASSGDNARALRDWSERNRKAWEAQRKETDRLLEKEWGSEWLANDKRWKLPSRVLRELDEHARQAPEVARLWAELGDNPYERAAVEWQPVPSLLATWSAYLVDYGATGPTKRIAARIRPILWSWVQTAFDLERELGERTQLARRFFTGYNSWGIGGWLGREILQDHVPTLLLESKEPLRPALASLLKSSEGLYRQSDYKGDELFAGLWLTLAAALGGIVRKPYNVKPEEWELPTLQPETLREITADLKAGKATEHILSSLKQTMDDLEAARRAQQKAALEVVPEPEPVIVVVSSSPLKGDDVLDAEEARRLFNGEIPTEEAHAKVKAAIDRADREIVAMNVEERASTLVEPPHPRGSHKIISRLPYWKVWANSLGENGAQKLKEALWARTKPKLWARFELKLEEYRRAETDPVEPRIEQKLTERELKEWRAQTRRDKRALIAREIYDIAGLLIEADGFSARIKAIELADRPSCRDVRDQLENGLFYELEKYPGHYASPTDSASAWQEWKLEQEWDAVLDKLKVRLGDIKDEWSRSRLERELAIGYYRRGDFEKFKLYATRPKAFPHAVSNAITAFDDFEAWRVLIGAGNQWESGPLAVFWKAQLDDEARKSRAIEVVVATLASTSDEAVSKILLSWLAPLPATELEPFVADIEPALESALVPVKRWAMTVLGTFKTLDFDRERAVQSAGESLWSEVAGLAKDAAKFLSQLALQDEIAACASWEALVDAASLDNIAVNEAVFRALSQIKAKNSECVLSDAAREKLEQLVEVQNERFGKFGKKLLA